MKKQFLSMVDMGYHDEKAWYQKVDGEIIKHIDPNFYGVYGNNEEGYELSYMGEDMKEPWLDNMYYDKECTDPIDISDIEI